MDAEKLLDFVENAKNTWIQDAIFKANIQIQDHEKIACSISGGSDSDIMLDLLHRLDDEKKKKKDNLYMV